MKAVIQIGKLGSANDISRTTVTRSWNKFWRWPNLPLLSPSKRGALLSKQSQRRERSEARSRVHRHHTVQEGMCGIKSSKLRQSCPKGNSEVTASQGSERDNTPPGLNTKKMQATHGFGGDESKKRIRCSIKAISRVKSIPSANIPLPPFPFPDFLSPSIALQLLPLIM